MFYCIRVYIWYNSYIMTSKTSKPKPVPKLPPDSKPIVELRGPIRKPEKKG